LSTGSKFRCVASTCFWTNVSLLAKKRGWQETVFQAFKNKARNLWIGAPAKREINKTLTLCGFCGALQICINTMATPMATAATTRSCSSNNWHNAPLTMQHVVVVACSLACCELCSEFYLFVFPGPVPATHQPTNFHIYSAYVPQQRRQQYGRTFEPLRKWTAAPMVSFHICGPKTKAAGM